MPRFFFDVDTDEHRVPDVDGQNMPDAEAAGVEATMVLSDVMRSLLPDGLTHDVTSTVRNGEGAPVFRATLSLRAEWL